MGIGVSIFLIAVGAVLTFALDLSVDVPRVGAVDMDVVGWILIAVGAIGLLVALVIGGRQRREIVTRGRGPHDSM